MKKPVMVPDETQVYTQPKNVIHATARAMERLRWPKSAREIQYIFPIAKLACGLSYSGIDTAMGLNLFRAEDAYALLNDSKTSVIRREAYFGESLLNSVLGLHHVEPRIVNRKWKMPDCEKCCIELDWALEHPYVIHTARHTFEDRSKPRRMTPAEKLAEQQVRKTWCGAPVLTNTPIFTHSDLQRAKRTGDSPWLPTCPECRSAVLRHFGWHVDF